MSEWQAFIDLVESHQCDWSLQPDAESKDGDWGIYHEDIPPHNRLLGPVFPRGKTSGIIDLGGKRGCSWGDTGRADMTFSVTKTYLALVAGKAFELGLIPDLDQTVLETLQKSGSPQLGFEADQNASITWRHMLQFTSEWEGSCFGVPDQVDHYRVVGLQQDAEPVNRKGEKRRLQTPGTYWEYNDVRINQFSRALLHLFKKPLPDVLDDTVMQPLKLQRMANQEHGWHWHGYDNSWVSLDGKQMQSVPGGGHWGGGMVISAEQQATIARALVDDINAKHKTPVVASPEWLAQMLAPCDIAPFYGFFSWLNTGHCVSRAASTNSFFAMGVGGQLILHDPDNDLVAVLRWIDSAHTGAILEQLYATL